MHKRITLSAMLIAVALLVPVGRTVAAAPEDLDWSTWKRLPVLHDGRIQPFDSFARAAVDIISQPLGRPKYDLAGSVPKAELKTARYAEARKLFPGDEPRRFDPVELVVSWIVESEKWEDVPFLIAEHEELRKKLGLPLVTESGEKLRYVSPRELRESETFLKEIERLNDARRAAAMEQQKFTLRGVDVKLDELFQAATLYQQLIFDMSLDGSARKRFEDEFSAVAELWQALDRDFALFAQFDQTAGLAKEIAAAGEAFEQLFALSQQPSFRIDDADPPASTFADASRRIAAEFTSYERKFRSAQPADWDAEAIERASRLISRLADQTRELAARADAVSSSLYDNREWLRVVPALNAAALERERDVEDDSQPWLDLQTLILGSDSALRAYPQNEIKKVREAFRRVEAAYVDRSAANRNTAFAEASHDFAFSLRVLGGKLEPLRAKLPIKEVDAGLIEYTRYPAEGATDTEVSYNAHNPFLWSWIVMLLACFCFCFSFLSRRVLTWVGTVFLSLSLAFSVWGFAMRVAITSWAPVTNMYETLIYVPFVVAVLGAWFMLLPITWSSIRRAWHLTAIPMTWESRPLRDEQTPGQFSIAQALLLMPRAGLMLAIFMAVAVLPYSAGGRTIVNLLPNRDVGSSLPGANDLLTWLVGMFVLVTAVWFLPRAIMALVVGFARVPLGLDDNRRGLSHVYARWPFGVAATSMAWFGAFVAWYSPLDSNFSPLQPVLRDNFWLLIHVLTIVSSYGAGALAVGLGILGLLGYIFGEYREPVGAAAFKGGHRPAGGGHEPRFGKRPPEICGVLAGYVYKVMQVAVILLAAGTILGGLWADVSWGRFWGWDPKEVWALISLLVYLAILHGRFAGWLNNFGLCVGSVAGATAILMSWYGVNFYLGVGLHSYGFEENKQGQLYVGGGALALWLVVVAPAAIRYVIETGGGPPPQGPLDAEVLEGEPAG